MIAIGKMITLNESKLTSIFWNRKSKMNENKYDKKLQIAKKIGGRI